MKKIKHKAPTPPPVELEDIGEDEAFDIFVDGETHEIVIAESWRKAWGDEVDFDTENAYTASEARELVMRLLACIEELEKPQQVRIDPENIEIVDKPIGESEPELPGDEKANLKMPRVTDINEPTEEA